MATNYSNQQTTAATTWVQYVPAKDCALGVCSSYCPQWCNAIIPQPPPALLDSGAVDGSTARTFSPLVIAVIGFLASAFVLLSYYTIVTKYCGTFSSPRWRLRERPGTGDDDDGGLELDEAWYISSPSDGLDEASVGKIAVHKYKRPSHGGDGTDCAVCLSEFKEDESLRVLPKCSHAFHVRCIDTWLKSHCSCPLCRADLVWVNSPSSPGPEPEVAGWVVDNPATDGAQESGAATPEGGHAIDIVDDEDFQSLRRSLSIDSLGGVVSSSRWAAPEQSSSRRLCSMKRSFSSGRLSLTMQGKGRNAVLPI